MVPERLRHTLKMLAACTPSRGTTSPTNIWSRGTMMRGSPIPCSTCAVSKLATIQSLVIGRSKKHPIAITHKPVARIARVSISRVLRTMMQAVYEIICGHSTSVSAGAICSGLNPCSCARALGTIAPEKGVCNVDKATVSCA
jgi:hypothetical protein